MENKSTVFLSAQKMHTEENPKRVKDRNMNTRRKNFKMILVENLAEMANRKENWMECQVKKNLLFFAQFTTKNRKTHHRLARSRTVNCTAGVLPCNLLYITPSDRTIAFSL